MSRLALLLLVSIVAAQEPHPPAGEPATPAAEEQAPEPTLADADRETIELIRWTLQNDRDGARELLREVVAALEDPEPGREASHIAFLLELDGLAKELGSLEDMRRLREFVVELRRKHLPPEHPELLRAKVNLAVTKRALGDLQGERELEEEVVATWRRLLSPEHPDLLLAEGNLAVTKRALGDLQGALELEEKVLAVRTRVLPPEHPDLLRSKLNLAMTRASLGDHQGAHELFEEVFAARTRLLPPEHPDLLRAKGGLAATKQELGDLHGARELQEEVLATWARLLPPEHPDLLATKLNLSLTKFRLDDFQGARELQEEVLAIWARLLPPEHPDLLTARLNLAATKRAVGDLHGALEIEEEVLAARTRLLPPEHPDLLATRLNLAETKKELGDLHGARDLIEEGLATWARILPPEHPDLLNAMWNLAVLKYELGDLQGAVALFEVGNEARTRLLPAEHPYVLGAKRNLAMMKTELGDHQGARKLIASLLEGQRARARSLRAESARAAREGATAELDRLFAALFVSESGASTDGLVAELFATLESLRLASVASSEVTLALAERAELDEKRRALGELRIRLNDLVAFGPGEGVGLEDWRRELRDLAFERDELERALREALAEEGVFVGELDAASVARGLRPNALAISFLRYPRHLPRDPDGKWPPPVDSLLAFAVRPNGEVTRIELGPARAVEALAESWRASIGRPLAGRGIGAVLSQDEEEQETQDLGQRLRTELLDPVLAVAEEVKILHVVADDFLHLVPLDALPLEDAFLGERIVIHNEISFARLVHPPAPSGAQPRLVLAGAIDYDAELGLQNDPRLDALIPPTAERAGAPALGFAPLAETAAEAEAVARLFREAFGGDVLLLTAGKATKVAVASHAHSARFLHLATHGWFAPETFRSQLDALGAADELGRASFARAEETVRGFAPETLCGLALAGANQGRDAVGRVPGILTAEELSTLDLRNCELAVLSACETNVGIRRAGQGIQSLQAALHGAGVRTAITSLWKVDDAATRRLFELFYGKLWKEKLGKAEALWQAKMALRAEGHPLRDWAGWVLSGDPE